MRGDAANVVLVRLLDRLELLVRVEVVHAEAAVVRSDEDGLLALDKGRAAAGLLRHVDVLHQDPLLVVMDLNVAGVQRAEDPRVGALEELHALHALRAALMELLDREL